MSFSKHLSISEYICQQMQGICQSIGRFISIYLCSSEELLATLQTNRNKTRKMQLKTEASQLNGPSWPNSKVFEQTNAKWPTLQKLSPLKVFPRLWTKWRTIQEQSIKTRIKKNSASELNGYCELLFMMTNHHGVLRRVQEWKVSGLPCKPRH